MDRYKHISFEIKSKRFIGWGERASEKLFMDDGNYTIFPQVGDYKVDNGTTQQAQSAGAHPFLVFQITETNNWAGLFLFNSNPMSLELNKTGTLENSNKTWSRVIIRTTGGSLDFFIFYGPTYSDVIRQYQEITGKPQMLPAWA
jgi:alpha-glucosidase (family GH31 glycosyl hydrolase)